MENKNNENKIIVLNNELSNIINSGQDFLVKVGYLMDNVEFRDFFDDNFGTWSDIEAAIMMMKIYRFVQEEYLRQTGKQVDRENGTKIVRSLFMNVECRKIMIEEMNSFMKNKNNTFMASYISKLIKNN